MEKKARGLNKKAVLEWTVDIAYYLAGSVLYAVALNCFMAPNEIVPGGVSSLATMANYLWGLPIGVMIFVINIPLFILGFLILGRKFIIKTFIATALLSVAIDLLAPLLPTYEGDKILAALFGGALAGVGLSLNFIRGATTGGPDILAKLVQRRWRHISMGKVILAFDFVVIALAAVLYKSIESALYACIVIFVSSKLIDTIIYGMGNGKMMLIVTAQHEAISKKITEELERGTTIIPVIGGYTGEQRRMLYCVMRTNEVSKVTRIVHEMDENAFITVSEAREIFGLGFNKID